MKYQRHWNPGSRIATWIKPRFVFLHSSLYVICNSSIVGIIGAFQNVDAIVEHLVEVCHSFRQAKSDRYQGMQHLFSGLLANLVKVILSLSIDYR